MNKEQREAINVTIDNMEVSLNSFDSHDYEDLNLIINPNDFTEDQVDIILTFVNSFRA